jgi:nucleotide-binding universal stress UspA family protein
MLPTTMQRKEHPMLNRILVAVDGSTHAAAALDMAGDIAARCGSSVTVLHVMDRTGSDQVPDTLRRFVEIEGATVTEADVLRGVADEIVERATRRLRERGVTGVRAIVEHGSPAQRIIEVAEEIDADLIALGRRGLGRLTGTVLGSVSQEVSTACDRPCLTIK